MKGAVNSTVFPKGNRASATWNGSRVQGYDAFERLSSISINGATVGQYWHNAHHQRAMKRTAAGDTRFVYGQGGELLSESGAGGTVNHIWLFGQPLAVVKNGSLYYVHGDQLGRPEVLSTPTGAIAWKANLSGWNRTVAVDSVGGYPLGYPGQYFDAESGLWQNWHRSYDGQLGRYIQSDPIGLAGGINTYQYAEGNPVSYTDPTGEFVPQLIGFGIGAGLEYLTNPCASATDILLAGGLGALGGGLSKAAFLRLGPRSLTRDTGLEWSHSIARSTVNRHTSGGLNSVLNQRGGLNGSWRTPASHARHDASRHVPGVDPMPLPLRALDRIPDWLKGTGLGGGVGAAVAGGDCECRR